jgi:hypothetical protein
VLGGAEPGPSVRPSRVKGCMLDCCETSPTHPRYSNASKSGLPRVQTQRVAWPWGSFCTTHRLHQLYYCPQPPSIRIITPPASECAALLSSCFRSCHQPYCTSYYDRRRFRLQACHSAGWFRWPRWPRWRLWYSTCLRLCVGVGVCVSQSGGKATVVHDGLTKSIPRR